MGQQVRVAKCIKAGNLCLQYLWEEYGCIILKFAHVDGSTGYDGWTRWKRGVYDIGCTHGPAITNKHLADCQFEAICIDIPNGFFRLSKKVNSVLLGERPRKATMCVLLYDRFVKSTLLILL